MVHNAAQVLGKRIKDLRLDKKWTQAALAEALGCESMTVSRYERGEYAPSLEILVQIAAHLNVSISEFFEPSSTGAQNDMAVRHRLCDIAYHADEAKLKDILIAAEKILKKSD